MTVTRNPETGSESVKWNATALIGRQVVLLGSSVLIARILGPAAYGVIAQATIYSALTTLVLDQGLSAALITKARTTRRQLGAAAGLNLVLAAVLFGITVLIGGLVADFFDSTELSAVLTVLAGGLFVKAAAIVPRVVLMREMNFRAMAIAEPMSALIAAVAAIVAAILGLSYWSLVLQIIIADTVLLAMLVRFAHPPRPNLHLGELRDTLGFSVRALGDQFLSFVARNGDNILVSRWFGGTQLSYYSLSYRVLLTPIQMIGQVVTRVLFPAVARVRGDAPAVHRLVERSERAIAVMAFPLMLLVSAASYDLVQVFLGQQWHPAAPVLAVLAVTGARQAVTSINSPLLLAMNRPDVQLRFSVTATVVQLGGMIVGAPFGILGVAIGYTVAGFVLTPVIALVQRAVTGMSVRQQAAPLVAPLHAALWSAAAYVALGAVPGLTPPVHLLAGAVAGAVVYTAVLRFVHPSSWDVALSDARAVTGL